MKYFRNVYIGRYVLFSLVKRDLNARYRGTILGVAWSLITPIGLAFVIGSVFSLLWGRPMESFIPYLFSGLMPWLFFANCAQGGTNAYLSAQGYIKQTSTPVEIFPIRTALVEYVNLLFSILALFLALLFIAPATFHWNMLYLVVSLVIWLVFGVAVSNIAALINTYFRDYAMIQTLVIQALFYVTPIVWPIDMLQASGHNYIYELNPIYYMLEIIRLPMLGQIPETSICLVALSITALLVLLSILFTSVIGRKITFRL